MIRQHIRLKEFTHNIKKIHIPTEAYLKGAPQLDKNRAYFQSVDDNGFTMTGNFFMPEFTIAVVGDSFVENIFVDEISRFEAILERNFLAIGKRVKVINAGVSGMTGLAAFNLILNKLVRIRPNILLYVQPSIDFSALLYEDGYFNDSKLFSNLVPPLETQVPLYETIYENRDQIYNNLVLISKVCKLNNIELIVATCDSNSSRRQLLVMNSIIRENAKDLEYKVLDLDSLLEKGGKNFYDKQHLNKQGAFELSKIIFEYLGSFNFEVKNPCELTEKNIDFSTSEDNLFTIPSSHTGIVEAWLSISTIPRQDITLEGEVKLVIKLSSRFDNNSNYNFNINILAHKGLQQTINLGSCKSGTYSLSIVGNKELPVIVESCHIYYLKQI